MIQQIETLAAQLAEKGSWIRKGVQKWLELWEEATSTTLDDSKLERVVITTIDEASEHGHSRVYYLQRGYAYIYRLWDDEWNFQDWDKESATDIGSIDMRKLRTIINGLAPTVEKYAQQIESETAEYNKLAPLLPR